jgi:hypothetical protein
MPSSQSATTTTRRSERRKGHYSFAITEGTKWGIQGYGWLPYDYVESGLAEVSGQLCKANTLIQIYLKRKIVSESLL